ncbi:hypothetical protein MTR67_040067 [Solanum verrucosum]|uniref:Uncharacterized protein n=1 Tax=Solanum verrucosum TaxID=315347 RepID=A0AAF0ZP49_SOLVR|nr:hypothetical protein MTR67_040067 [Solanum verrucosum]
MCSIPVEVKTHNLMSNSWRNVDNRCPPSVLFYNVWGKFVNGKLHWASTTAAFEYTTINVGNWNIVSIDLAYEKWGKVEKPIYGKGDIVSRLEVLGRNLFVFYNNKGMHVSIWVMMKYIVKNLGQGCLPSIMLIIHLCIMNYLISCQIKVNFGWICTKITKG